MRYIPLFFSCVIILLSGCVTHVTNELQNTALIDQQEQSDVSVPIYNDSLTGQIEYTGPPYPNTLLATNIFLRAIKPRPATITLYQIYILAYYKSDYPRNYEKASDGEGNNLELLVMSRDVGNRTGYGGAIFYDEHMIINVSRKYLEARLDSGLRIQISGDTDAEQITLPGCYITDFLDLVPADGED